MLSHVLQFMQPVRDRAGICPRAGSLRKGRKDGRLQVHFRESQKADLSKCV